MRFVVTGKDSNTAARTAEMGFDRGIVQTPVFMPVGTFGTIRNLTYEHLEEIGVQMVLSNTYHLLLRPGMDVLRDAGGYHRFSTWQKPILTDSGGFQVFSLAKQREITKNGVRFRSYVDHRVLELTPESCIAAQETIGSDVMMVLDVCPPARCARSEAASAVRHSQEWALRCLDARTKNHLFAIAQGGLHKDLREESAKSITALPFDGYAIGGLAVGESRAERIDIARFTATFLPEDKPRYMMGVGTPVDLLDAVSCGVDMFDCILPQNHARQGIAYHFQGKTKIRREIYRSKHKPIDASCGCFVCKRYSLAYLHQLLRCEEPTAGLLIGYHNAWFYERFTESMRMQIQAGSFESFRRDYETKYLQPEED